MIPKRAKRPKMNVRESSVVRCAGHLKWVRGHECLIAGKRPSLWDKIIGWFWGDAHECTGRIEAHHVREGSNGGIGLKPDDATAVPLCTYAHIQGHQIGWQTFETRWKVDLDATAADLWKASPHGRAWRLQHEQADAPQGATQTPQARK